ncbi:MAG: hypothetical protein CUN55_13675 [Phototrophicales bacterium]|nr:MAG: hypothetical protein CUN55_13675 [Phototrophicales bacterium]
MWQSTDSICESSRCPLLCRTIRRICKSNAHWALSILLLIALIVAWAVTDYFSLVTLEDYLLNSWTELLGILAGVFVLDALRRLDEREKFQEDLIRQAGSSSNPHAKDAIDIIRAKGKLTSEDSWLREQNLSYANLAGARLLNANLRGADLTGCNLTDAELTGADLTDAILTDACLRKTKFIGAKLIRTNLNNSDLSGADCKDAQLENVKFNADTTIKKTDFERVDFTQVDLVGIRFLEDTILRKAQFKGDMRGVHFDGVDLREAEFEGVNLSGATITNCKAQRAKLNNADMTGADLSNSEFEYAEMRRAVLKDANYEGANFYSAELFGANFTKTPSKEGFIDVHEAVFIEAKFNSQTVLPDGSHWNPEMSDEELFKKFSMIRNANQSSQSAIEYDSNYYDEDNSLLE